MTREQFWFGDVDLLKSYQKAYYRNTSYKAWANGYYAFIAYDTVLGNAFKEKGKPPDQYPEWKDPMEKYDKPVIKKENVEHEFRKQQVEQNAWFFSNIRK